MNRAMVARCLVLMALVLGGLHALVGCDDSGTVEGDEPSRLDKSCKTDADCGSNSQLACGVTAAGEHRCVASCASPSSGYVCIDGVPTSCEVAPAEHCKECGCPNALRCEVGVGCMPKRAAGESCAADSDCNTNNCCSFAGVCRVPYGSACTTLNCDLCLVASNWSFCTRRCGDESGVLGQRLL